MPPQTSNDNSLDDNSLDILRGAEEIAAFARLKIRDCYFKLEKGYLPGRKEGNIWTSTKSLLRAHYNTPTNLKPPASAPTDGAEAAKPPASAPTDGAEAAPRPPRPARVPRSRRSAAPRRAAARR